MTGPNDIVEVIDIHGPFAGRSRPYKRHAAEAAVANGFARWPDDEPDEPAGLPEDFPGRSELMASGKDTLDKVPTVMADLTDIPGIGKKTAGKILQALHG